MELSTWLSGNSTSAQHLINHGHSVGLMEDIMNVIFTAHKVKTPGYSSEIPHISENKK